MEEPSEQELGVIRDHIADTSSKIIFEKALEYSLSYDVKHIKSLVLSHDEGKKFYKKLIDLSGNIAIYGAGERGQALVEMYPEINFCAFIDKNKNGKICNLNVYSIRKCKETFPDINIVVSPLRNTKGIVEELIGAGFLREKIIVIEDYNKTLQLKQYSDCVKFPYDSMQTMYDVGGYDGCDSEKFYKQGMKEIWCFEPDEFMYDICVRKFGGGGGTLAR